MQSPVMSLKILLLSLEFAPVQTTGAFRPISLAKYLPEFDVIPIVVTLDSDAAMKIWHAQRNDDLSLGISPSVTVLRLNPKFKVKKSGPISSLLRRFFSFDDGHHKSLKKSLAEVIQKNPELREVSAVLATIPPFGAGMLGVEASRALAVPYILDARDAWTQSDSGMPAPSYLHYFIQKSIERKVISRCSALIANTERMRKLYERDHPYLPLESQYVVANGFEGDLIVSTDIVITPVGETFKIGYVGSLYGLNPPPSFLHRLIRPYLWFIYSIPGQFWQYRGLRYFFSAWQRLMRDHPDIGGKIRFHYIGPFSDALMKAASEYGLDKYCICWGSVPKDKVNEILADIDVMLSTSMKKPEGGDFCMASKTFDYIQARKPILAYVCEGSLRDFLDRSGLAILCDPDNIMDSAEKLKKLVTEGITLTPKVDYINQFHRREASRRISNIIYEVLGKVRRDDAGPTHPSLPYI